MDQGPEATAANSVIISGLGCAVGMPCPSERYLKTPKSRKFMGKQDHLAVCAAGRALESAGLNSSVLGPTISLTRFWPLPYHFWPLHLFLHLSILVRLLTQFQSSFYLDSFSGSTPSLLSSSDSPTSTSTNQHLHLFLWSSRARPKEGDTVTSIKFSLLTSNRVPTDPDETPPIPMELI